MIDDSVLLRRYLAERSEPAFAELVRRHVNLVYSAALRQLNGAVHRAEDVTQNVFIDLARKAPALTARADLTGWLFTSTHYAAAKLKRSEQRRQSREQEAPTMQDVGAHSGEADWARLRPVLDEAMNELSERDREAILLRFFQGQRFTEVARRLGLRDDAARMRVERALEKLRVVLARRGVTSSAAALGLALEAAAIGAAPAGLANAVTAEVMARAMSGAVIAGSSVSIWPIAGVGTLALAGVAALFVQAQGNADLTSELAALRVEQRAVIALRRDNERLARAVAESGSARANSQPTGRGLPATTERRRDARNERPRSTPGVVAPGELVSLTLPDADLATVFSALRIYTGQEIIRDASLQGVRAIVSARADKIPREEAIELLRTALREQANVVLVPTGDGRLLAKRGPGTPPR